jgi:hypothetical protein
MDSTNIIVNPLNIIAIPIKPTWFCNHDGAKLIDCEKKLYRCIKCDKKNRIIVKFSQEKLLSNFHKF